MPSFILGSFVNCIAVLCFTICEIGSLNCLTLYILVIPYFRDHITLDNLSTTQLQNFARYMHISALGPDVVIRERLRKRVKLF